MSFLLVLFVFSLFANQGFTGPDKLKQKFSLVDRFLTKSRTAKRIAAQGKPEVKAIMAEAKAIYNQAVKARSSGDNKKVGILLDRALKLAISASKKAANPASKQWLYKSRYEDLLTSVKNFSVTLKRYLDQSGKSDSKALEKIQSLIKNARQQAAKKQYQTAITDLKQAQSLLTSGIKKVLGSRSLVYELKFDTPKEEYQYEVNRGDSFEALVRMMLTQGTKASGKQKLVDPMVAKYFSLRLKARNQASAGAYEKAISSQEEANKFLTRALRSLGLMIPM
ncbi:MAG: hypothetical protein HQL69_01925 [Magnetococcales bacterium]|nr:hypothetical protein [Magnetococcales bacterium]